MVVVLPLPFTPTTSTIDGFAATFRSGSGKREKTLDVFAEARDGLIGGLPGFLFGDGLQPGQNLLRRRNADVGEDQRFFQFVPELAVQGPARFPETLDPREGLAGLPEGGAQPVKPLHGPSTSPKSSELLFAFFPIRASSARVWLSTRKTYARISATTA